MFWDRIKIDGKMIQNLHPTSKIGLKQMCLMASNGDLEKANKIYEYMIKDLDDLPVFDPIRPSTMQQVKSGVSETFQWLSQNQDQILVWADLLSGLFRGNRTNNTTSLQSVSPIPPINR